MKIRGVYIGMPKPFEPNPKIQSGFYKESTTRAIKVAPGLLQGDGSANEKHHGGPDRVIHHYPQEHYQIWKNQFPEAANLFLPGSIGENISTLGVIESDLCIGDVFTLGSSRIQITEGRKPCGFIDARYGVRKMHLSVRDQIKMGWFYRVLEPGEFALGDTLILVERPCNWAPLAEVSKTIMQKDSSQTQLLERLADTPELSERWRQQAKDLLLRS
ncbi:MAG: MOSC domain-containing protein [Bdellovibrionales bacterium]